MLDRTGHAVLVLQVGGEAEDAAHGGGAVGVLHVAHVDSEGVARDGDAFHQPADLSRRSARDSGANHRLVVDAVQGLVLQLDQDFRASCEWEDPSLKHAMHKLFKYYVEKCAAVCHGVSPVAPNRKPLASMNSENSLDWPVLKFISSSVFNLIFSVCAALSCSSGRRPSVRLTYDGDKHAVGVIIFLARELALVLPLRLHAGHDGRDGEVGEGVGLREAEATERPPVEEAGQPPGRPPGVDLALPLGPLEVALLSQVPAAQVDLLAQESCDILRELNTWTLGGRQ